MKGLRDSLCSHGGHWRGRSSVSKDREAAGGGGGVGEGVVHRAAGGHVTRGHGRGKATGLGMLLAGPRQFQG